MDHRYSEAENVGHAAIEGIDRPLDSTQGQLNSHRIPFLNMDLNIHFEERLWKSLSPRLYAGR